MTRIRTTMAAIAGSTLAVGLAGPAHGAAAPDACEGQGEDCSIVSRADVDGDGQRDSVGMWSSEAGDDGSFVATIRVQTAAGETLETTTDIRIPHIEPWWGAAKIDGEAGHELVLQSDEGAHTGWYRAITYRDGRLTTLNDPNGEPRWAIDSAATSGSGYRRTTMSSGEPLMYSYRAEMDETDERPLHTITAVRWSDGRWAQVSKRTKRVDEEEHRKNLDWNVPYLPKRY